MRHPLVAVAALSMALAAPTFAADPPCGTQP